ncbi:hypothetical protein IE81DRAFT_362793 [Ceraceosorus guamensis]|uniref:Uncharacterized protein n=1 Tax=Ceraceosorus guamensis TaxID=1522189 RepID=A0A316W4V4_9BASI|nr:hypothetical protein IE81DRAFT_362793 [Ceraceosorus guamensis]PWN44762.1 hypothetical protein IE81DRAFT_362793 [Ceraceosorus guamensis]
MSLQRSHPADSDPTDVLYAQSPTPARPLLSPSGSFYKPPGPRRVTPPLAREVTTSESSEAEKRLQTDNSLLRSEVHRLEEELRKANSRSQPQSAPSSSHDAGALNDQASYYEGLLAEKEARIRKVMGQNLALWKEKGQLAVQNAALSSASAEDKATIARLEKLVATQKDRIKKLRQSDKEREEFFDKNVLLYQDQIKMCKEAVKEEKLRSEAELFDADEARDVVEGELLEMRSKRTDAQEKVRALEMEIVALKAAQHGAVWLPELVHGEMEANQSLLSELGEDNVFDDQEGLEDRQNDQHLEQFLDSLAS